MVPLHSAWLSGKEGSEERSETLSLQVTVFQSHLLGDKKYLQATTPVHNLCKSPRHH